MKNRYDVALEVAREAGEIIRKYFRGELAVSTKKNYRDLLTNIDLTVEKKIVQLIKRNFPDDNIYSEETRKDSLSSSRLWIIDPLDGTTNYVTGLPFCCTSIAYAYNSQVVLAVIYDPFSNDYFMVQKGKGAFLNKKKLSVSKTKNLSYAIVSFDYSSVDDYRRNIQRVTSQLPMKVRGTRMLGAACLGFAYVAAGFFDAYICRGAYPWDVASGALLIEESGGKITDWQGGKWQLNSENFLASNGKLHQELLGMLAR